MNVINTPIASIKPYPHNPRVNDAAIAPVAKSITDFGWNQPLVLDKDHVIIVGHTRYYAAKSLNITEVPCLIAHHLTPEQAKAYRLADNRTNENSEWDTGLLIDELMGLQAAGVDLELTAFTKDELKAFLNEQPPATPGSLGETFIVPPFSILQGGNPNWLERKKQWSTSLNLASGESREHVQVLPSKMGKGYNQNGSYNFEGAAWCCAPGAR